MEINQLIMFANISAITYDNPKDSKNKFKSFGFTTVEFFDSNGAQAYLLKDTNGIHVLSFRGTEVSQKSDILADLKAGKNIEACGGKVHVGFKGDAIQMVLDKLNTTDKPKKSIDCKCVVL